MLVRRTSRLSGRAAEGRQAVTAAYNLMWGCKRYDYDADVELFINVIQVRRRFVWTRRLGPLLVNRRTLL